MRNQQVKLTGRTVVSFEPVSILVDHVVKSNVLYHMVDQNINRFKTYCGSTDEFHRLVAQKRVYLGVEQYYSPVRMISRHDITAPPI